MADIYTVEQQQKVHELTEAIIFYSHRVAIFRVDGARDTLQEKCDDLMKYVDSVEKLKESKQ